MNIFSRRGFSFVEIMVVIAIIAIIMAIVIPNLFHMLSSSKRTICIANLHKIATAVEQFALDNKIPAKTNLSQQQEDDIYSNYLRGGKPKCPSGGEYVIDPVDSDPQVQCTEESEGHKI